MNKILVSTKKKVEVDKTYLNLVESQQIQVEKLRPILDRQVIKFVNSLGKSQELNDAKVARCGLRMLNSLFIVRKLAEDKKL